VHGEDPIRRLSDGLDKGVPGNDKRRVASPDRYRHLLSYPQSRIEEEHEKLLPDPPSESRPQALRHQTRGIRRIRPGQGMVRQPAMKLQGRPETERGPVATLGMQSSDSLDGQSKEGHRCGLTEDNLKEPRITPEFRLAKHGVDHANGMPSEGSIARDSPE